MLSEEDKKTIERIEDVFYQNKGKGINSFQKITLYEDRILDIIRLLNKFEELQKENEELTSENISLFNDLEQWKNLNYDKNKRLLIANKQIELMAEFMNRRSWKDHQLKDKDCYICNTEYSSDECVNCIKEYFEIKSNDILNKSN